MKIHRLLLASILTVCASVANAATKSEMIQELMRIQGIHEMIEQARVANEAQVRQTSQNMVQELRKQFSTLPEAFMKELMGAVDRFTKSATLGWTTPEAVEQWERLYGAEMTADDVAKVLDFYKSPVGQRDIAASKAAMPKWGAFFTERAATTMDRAMKVYVAEVRQIVGRATSHPK